MLAWTSVCGGVPLWGGAYSWLGLADYEKRWFLWHLVWGSIPELVYRWRFSQGGVSKSGRWGKWWRPIHWDLSSSSPAVVMMLGASHPWLSWSCLVCSDGDPWESFCCFHHLLESWLAPTLGNYSAREGALQGDVGFGLGEVTMPWSVFGRPRGRGQVIGSREHFPIAAWRCWQETSFSILTNKIRKSLVTWRTYKQRWLLT